MHTKFSYVGVQTMGIAAVVLAAGASDWAPAVFGKAAEGAGKGRPNIVFLLTDDQRWDALGCMGNAIIQTPNLDRLAAEGTLFTNTFCTTSICATSRASFLTGQYARRHGVHDFRTPLSAEAFAETFPALLRKHGYHTGFVGKWGIGGELPVKAFDLWDGFAGQGRYFGKGHEGHLTQHLGGRAVEFLRSAPAGRPFLLCMSFKAAHVQDGDPHPFQPDPAYDDLYRTVEVPVPVTATPAAFGRLPPFLRTSEGRVRWNGRFANPQMHQDSVKKYFRLVTGIDHVVGRLMATLRERGVADNTVIVFTSDNGFFLGERGLAGKWFMYEESIRLPLLIHDPRVPEAMRGQRVEPMTLSIDVAPTILELAGVDVPVRMQGRSLVPFVRGQSPAWRTEWFYEHLFTHRRIARSEGVRTERYKYVRYLDEEPPYEQLFDLRRDPGEQVNLAAEADHADVLGRLRERWKVLRAEAK